MTQNADNVLDHFDLFRGPEYTEMFKNKKKNFEDPVADFRVRARSRMGEDDGISGEELRPRSAGRKPG